MDIGLPKLGGIDACIAIRQHEARKKHFKETPIIALSEHVQIPEIEQCLEVGVNTILIKPLKPQYFDRLMISLENKNYQTFIKQKRTFFIFFNIIFHAF